jgi:hypothetical protein
MGTRLPGKSAARTREVKQRDHLHLGQPYRRQLYAPAWQGYDGRARTKAGLVCLGFHPLRKKGQGIDTDKILPLKAFADDVAPGGVPGHFSIAPVDDQGQIDMASLSAWAVVRGTGQTHGFTQILLDAVVQPTAKGGTP